MGETIYGYCRVSTPKQNIQRQVDNIKGRYPSAVIVSEKYTGTKMDRPAWNRLYSNIKSGDTIIFDEISRMSRNADEGFFVYKELYEKGVNLIFLKESALNTENFRDTQQIATVGNDIADVYIEATNKVLMMIAEKQIRVAFETAQHEVDFLHQRTREGMALAKLNGKQIGRKGGEQVVTKKSIEMKKRIEALSRDFDGANTDAEIIKITGLARNTYYKYKNELRCAESIC